MQLWVPCHTQSGCGHAQRTHAASAFTCVKVVTSCERLAVRQPPSSLELFTYVA